MVSKVQKTKDFQGYTKKPKQCNNCANYKSKIQYSYGIKVEANKRCKIGGFAVQSTASCDLYSKGG